MPKRQSLAGTFVAGRPIKGLEGVDYAVGDPIPDDVVARMRAASAYLSGGWIQSGETYARRAGSLPRAFVRRIRSLNSAERRTLGG